MRFIEIRFFIFLNLLCLCNCINAQEKEIRIPDSLSEKSYEYLHERIVKKANDTLMVKLYLNAYLNKAIATNDKVEKSTALCMMSDYENEDEKKLYLINEAIKESSSVDSSFSVLPYNTLGGYYYKRDDYIKALQQYLNVLRLSIKSNNKQFEIIALENIATIKSDIGKYDEALALYRKCFYLVDNNKRRIEPFIIETSFRLSESFRYIEQHDSASYYYSKVIDKVRKKYTYKLGELLINEGINLYQKGNLNEAKKLLREGISEIDNNSRYLILANYYYGKILQYEGKENALQYFLKVDDLLVRDNIVIPELKDVYTDLVSYYKKIDDHEKQLYFLNKLVTYNEKIVHKTVTVADKMHEKFDAPELLKNRDELIKNLQTKNQDLTTEKIALLLLLLLVIILFSIQYIKHKKYKKRFEKIVNELNNEVKLKKNVVKASSTSKLNIDSELVKDILNKLEVFESKKGFLKNTITITSLARKLSTNTKYLSKIINTYKDKTFITYINDLRIDYILKELHTNTILQQYTLLGIAKEIGFNSADSFSTAFKKKTGISPSYYIKSLNNTKKGKVKA